jgi:hypothetical protein
MELQRVCTRCESTNLELGVLNNPRGEITFRLSKSPFFTLISPEVRVNAIMCLDCGAIELAGDIAKAREVAKR